MTQQQLTARQQVVLDALASTGPSTYRELGRRLRAGGWPDQGVYPCLLELEHHGVVTRANLTMDSLWWAAPS